MTRVFVRTRLPRRAGMSTGAVVGGIVVLVLVLAAGIVIGRGFAGLRYDPSSVPPGEPAANNATAATTPTTPADTGGVRRPSILTPPAPGNVVPPAAAPITFDPVEIDFGTVLPDTDMHGTFTVTNIGDKPLTIREVKPDCKCTTIDNLAGAVIPPGGSIEASAVMEGPAAGGLKKASVAVMIDGFPPAIMRMRARIGRVVQVEPYTLTPTPETLAGVMTVTALDGRPFTILASNGEPPTYVDGFVPGHDEPRKKYEINYDLARWDQQSCLDAQGTRMPNWWIIETDHPSARIVDLQVRHVPCSLPAPLQGRLWVLSKQRVILDNLAPGEAAEFTVFLKWIRSVSPNDTIRAVTSDSEHFDAELVETTRDGDKIICRVRITPREGYEGLFKGDARFFGFLAGQSQTLRIIGRVETARTEHAAR